VAYNIIVLKIFRTFTKLATIQVVKIAMSDCASGPERATLRQRNKKLKINSSVESKIDDSSSKID
jgi:hypothetical protein